MIKGNDKLRLRPMSCPSHFFIYKKEIRSYKELPLRFSENAFLYRYESSGSLKGIERTRIMELSDAHIFLKLDQLFKEFENCYFLIKSILDDLKIKISSFSLSFHDPKNKSKFFDNKIM
jgi:threonyl-tRNA synthetase